MPSQSQIGVVRGTRRPPAARAGPSTQPQSSLRWTNKGKGRASPDPSSIPSSRASSPPSSAQELPDASSHIYPFMGNSNSGLEFPIQWNKLWLNERRLDPDSVGYRVSLRSLSSKAKTSPIWKYGADLIHTVGSQRTKLYLCKLCHLSGDKSALKRISTTAHILGHLASAHQIHPNSGQLMPTGSSKGSNPWEVAAKAPSASHAPWRAPELLKALVDFVVVNDVSFRLASSADLRGLISWQRQDLLAALPSSPTTLSTYIVQGMVRRKEEIRTVLKTSYSKIALSLDVWTSPNHHSFLGVVAHFLDCNNKPADVLIAFKNLLGDHSGAAIAQETRAAIADYDCVSKIHCLMADNATSNDGELIAGLCEDPDINLTMDNRLRCAGHIINLIVKAFLYGKVSGFEAEIARAAPQEQFQLYRKHGVVGKCHNFVNAILVSHKRRGLFKGIQRELTDEDPLWQYGSAHLIQDGGIRWNSTYAMLKRCYELKDAIHRFTRRLRDSNDTADAHDDYNPLTDALSEDDWDEVAQLVEYLKVFSDMTIKLEGKAGKSGYGSLWQTLPHLQRIWQKLHAWQHDLRAMPGDSYVKNAVEFAIQKLTTYFEKLVITPTVSWACVATALHPALRMLFFKDRWSAWQSWYKQAEKSLKAVYQQYVDDEEAAEEEEVPESPSRRKIPGGDVEYEDSDEDLMAVNLNLFTNKRSRKRFKGLTEVETYIDDIEDDLRVAKKGDAIKERPLDWWLNVGRTRYPTLYKVAIDFLVIPATSCECERCFSLAKQTITALRNHLSPSTIEALQLQRNWVQNSYSQ